MTQARKISLWVAGLFVVATVTSVLALVLLDPLTGAGHVVAAVSGAPGRVVAAVMLMFASAAAIIAIPVAFFPLLSRHSAAGALLYFAARVFESVAYLIGGIFTLGLLNAARSGADGATAMVLKDLADIAFATGPTLFFSLGAMVLAVLLWGSHLVPRWLSGWKLLGGALMLVQGVLTLAGPLDPMLETALFMPVAVNEMVLALWLIVKGFEPAALARLGA